MPLEHSGYGFVKFSFLNVLFELDLLCSDIFSMDFCIFCSQWLTYPSVKHDLSGFTCSQRVSIWSILFLMNLDQLFQEFTVSTFLLSPWSRITYCDLRSCARFLQLSCCRHDRAHLSWSVICDRWEFNFSHHRPIHFQFWFDQRLPRPFRPWSVYVIKVPILDILCFVNFYSVLGCVYISSFLLGYELHRLCQ